MRTITSAAALAATVLAVASETIAAESDSLQTFMQAYRCQIVDRLERIYAHGDPGKGSNRYLTIELPEHVHGYVQCIFDDGRTRLLCEAASGFYFNKLGTPRTFHLAAPELASLAALGFSTDGSNGNFRIELDMPDAPDLTAIADLMMTALHDSYGARADSKLKFYAPFAPRPTARCKPVS